MTFQEEILEGIPSHLPQRPPFDPDVNHAPNRKSILSSEEQELALRNALRYFSPEFHAVLLEEFKE